MYFHNFVTGVTQWDVPVHAEPARAVLASRATSSSESVDEGDSDDHVDGDAVMWGDAADKRGGLALGGVGRVWEVRVADVSKHSAAAP